MLMQSAIRYQAELDQLEHMTDSLWDVTAASLDKLIPSDFPSMDRNLLVKARNADHIQMFMSYGTLSPEVHTLVQQAGRQDSLLSLKMLALQENINAFEREKINFLNTLSQHHPSLYRYYADQFKEINKSKSY